MKILITGSNGFIGYNLYQWMRKNHKDAEVYCYDMAYGQDILDLDKLRAAVRGKDVVFHLAALTHVDYSISGPWEQRQLFIDINHKGTWNVLEACREEGVKMVHISTSEVYGASQHAGHFECNKCEFKYYVPIKEKYARKMQRSEVGENETIQNIYRELWEKKARPEEIQYVMEREIDGGKVRDRKGEGDNKENDKPKQVGDKFREDNRNAPETNGSRLSETNSNPRNPLSGRFYNSEKQDSDLLRWELLAREARDKIKGSSSGPEIEELGVASDKIIGEIDLFTGRLLSKKVPKCNCGGTLRFMVGMDESHPLNPMAGTYAVSKAAADHECRVAYEVFGQDVVVIRPFNQYGPHQSMEKLIPRFIKLATYGEPLTIHGDGQQKRDYVYAEDTASALWAAKDLPAGTIVNIGTENAYSINELADMIIRKVETRFPSIKVYVQKDTPRPNDLAELNGSYQLINKLCGWKPVVSLEEGIEKCVDWYSSNGYIQPPQILTKG